MNLPSLGNVGNFLKGAGDYLKVERTKSDRIVATAKSGDVKLSRTIYPGGRVVDTKSYKLKQRAYFHGILQIINLEDFAFELTNL